jgi:flagellar basal body-associated protein FliL
MSKRTIIISVIAVLAFVAALFSLWFEYRSRIAEAEAIINNEPEPEPIKKAPKEPKEPKVVNLIPDHPSNIKDAEPGIKTE